MPHESAEPSASPAAWLAAVAIGAGLALGVWWPLVRGGGLVGGDTYTYFLPQKQLYAEQLRNGEPALWHNRTGFGYPALGESQTALFYPPNRLLYARLDLNAAFNVNLILHYVLAFVFCWRLAVACRVSQLSSLVVALVYVYGWFPARVSLEWAIIGGTWLPAAAWLTTDFLRRPTLLRLTGLTASLAMTLLAGHFTLAFITVFLVAAMIGLHLLQLVRANRGAAADPSKPPPAPFACLVVLAAFLLAAPQLWPSYELKQRSQRDGARGHHDPGAGHVPPLYYSQLLAGWSWWHSPEIVGKQTVKQLPGSIASDTNKVEAHFYVGLIPLLLAVIGLLVPGVRRRLPPDLVRFWLVAGLFAAVYATGWLIPISKHLPGFGYFIGPGRWTIVTTLWLGLTAAATLDVLIVRRKTLGRFLICLAIGALTLTDVLWSSQYVADAVVVDEPPLTSVDRSWIRKQLEHTSGPPRVFAPGPNLINLLGVSGYPVYLGLSPSEYYEEALMFPDGKYFTVAQREWLLRCGFTHALTQGPLKTGNGFELVASLPDAFFARAWGRTDPLFLYRIADATGRIAATPPDALSRARIETHTPDQIVVSVTVSRDCSVELRELNYPGWTVTVDGRPAESPTEGLFRTVAVSEGSHTLEWRYRPTSLRVGFGLSVAGLLLLLSAGAWLKRAQWRERSGTVRV